MQEPSETKPQGTWSVAEIAGKPCEVFEPEGALKSVAGSIKVVLFLHDRDGRRPRDEPAIVAALSECGLNIVVPEGGHSWWTNRPSASFDPQRTAEQYVLEEVLPWIAERLEAKPPRIALMGIGMGGQGALRLALRHPDKFPVATAIAPAIDFQHLVEDGSAPELEAMYADAEAARQDTATLHIHPLYWPRHLWFCADPLDPRWHEGAERFRMKLSALGIPFECDLETAADGGGREYHALMARRAAPFIAERLEREDRRVP